jgi:hypothetical protein
VTPQHLKDLLSSPGDKSLLDGLTQLTNLLLAGGLDETVKEIIYGGRLIALLKKDGGIRPIAVGYVGRRLAAKCAKTDMHLTD